MKSMIRVHPDQYDTLIRMDPYRAIPYSVESPGFPGRLNELIDQTGLGTIALAEASGINKETISLWRKGDQKRYRVAKVALVAAELGSTAEELLGMSTDPGSSAARSQVDEKERSRRELLRRIAALGPVIEKLPELEILVAEARKLT
jgi:transcriptional regulator with XRE-family HTH domain